MTALGLAPVDEPDRTIALGDDVRVAVVAALTGAVDARREEVKAAREHARSEAREIKERIVEEAEHIAAEATHWKASGERMAELLEEWKAAPHADRAVEAVLWKRLSAARNGFTKRRKAYFANLEAEREDVRMRKEKLCEDAEVDILVVHPKFAEVGAQIVARSGGGGMMMADPVGTVKRCLPQTERVHPAMGAVR